MKIELYHTRVFEQLWEHAHTKRIMCFRGGARSSKTWSILQGVFYWLMTGQFGSKTVAKGSFSVVRETLPALKGSAYKDFIEILQDTECYQLVEHTKTMLSFKYKQREVNFFPTDDPAKLRGRKSTFVYINEANTVAKEAFDQLLLRTTEFAIIDLNPAGIESWCRTYVEETLYNKGDVFLDISTYKDNLKNLEQVQVDWIEGLKDTDLDLYNVYAKGQWIKSRSLVFPKVELCDRMPRDWDVEFYGIDFGFKDPTVCVHVMIKGRDMFIDEILFEDELLNHELANKLISHGVGKLYADSAEPKTIAELKRRGLRLRAVKKGRDSIRQGLGFIRQHNIFITKKSLKTIKEFREYRYKLDRHTLEPTEDPVDTGNHSIDATRYAIEHAMRKFKLKWG